MTDEMHRATGGGSEVRIAFVRHGQSAAEQIAKLGELRHEVELIVVTLVRAGDVRPVGQTLH